VTTLWGKSSSSYSGGGNLFKTFNSSHNKKAEKMGLAPTWPCLACTYLNDSSVSPEACAICGRYNPEFVTKLGILNNDEDEQQQQKGVIQLQVPKDFLCPITQDIMKDPVVAADGYTYEKRAITKWIKRKGTSPVTREELSKDRLFPNRLLKKQIEDFSMRARWVTTKAEVGGHLCALEASEVREYLMKKDAEIEPERIEVKRKINEVVDKIMSLEVEKEELKERLKELDDEEKESKLSIRKTLEGYKKSIEAVNAEQIAEGVKDPKVDELLDTIRLLGERVRISFSDASSNMCV